MREDNGDGREKAATAVVVGKQQKLRQEVACLAADER